jgi:glycine/sarcosine N-methyltransferase
MRIARPEPPIEVPQCSHGQSSENAMHPDSEQLVTEFDTSEFAGQYTSSFVDRWDDLIDWERRADGEGNFFIEMLATQGVKTVLDVACGSGYHSVRLLEAGFGVTASDGSQAMVAKAISNARRRGLPLSATVADWRELSRSVQGKFDAVLCLGSSFCHLRTAEDRAIALQNFSDVLNPGGLLLVDQRNFDSILAGRYQSKGKYYYCGNRVSVTFGAVTPENAEFIYRFPDGAEFRLSVYPITVQHLALAISERGFDYSGSFGDFCSPYDIQTCDFVIHAARKPSA